mgnify:CR=1 FL=1
MDNKEDRDDGKLDKHTVRGRTNDGLKIYTEEELGMNKAGAGMTDDCPFDCQCCY